MKVKARGYEGDRETRQTQMRKRILKAAMKLFLNKGYDNVTMRNIAAEIKYSPGTIYRYFTDKNEIFFTLRCEGFALFDKAMKADRQSSDPLDRLRQGFELYTNFALKHPKYYDIMFLMEAPIERASERTEWSNTTGSFDILRKDIRLAIEAGIICDDNIDRVAFSMWSLMHGALALILRRRTGRVAPMPDRELVDQVFDFVFINLTRG